MPAETLSGLAFNEEARLELAIAVLETGALAAKLPAVGAFAEPRRRSFSAGLHMKLTPPDLL
jgi:hypothetical protein